MYRYFVLIAICFCATLSAFAQPSISIQVNTTGLKQGDTLLLNAQVHNYKNRYGTLHLYIENSTHNLQWKFRYPLENGQASAMLMIPDSFPSGVYAIHAALRRELVHIMGMVKDKKPPTEINYMAVAANTEVAAATIKVEPDGSFQIPNLVFDEKATFIFSPSKKYKDNWLDVSLETPVDSSFYHLADTSFFVTVNSKLLPADTAGYRFSPDSFAYKNTTLQNVTVTAKAKPAAQQLVEKYAGGFFDREGYLFDGMSSTEIASAQTIFDFLIGRVAGLQIHNSRLDATFEIHWRGYEPVYFVDGMETDQQGVLSISPSEVAAIKVIRPPFYGVSMGSAGGAIAIFTKQGSAGGTRYGNQFRFVINGYTPQAAVWAW